MRPVDQRIAQSGEGRRHPLAVLLAAAYPYASRLRPLLRRVIAKLEGGEMTSVTQRRVVAKFHGIEAGYHSYGCFDPQRFGGLLIVGRYVSIGPGVRTFRRNHPLDRPSMHPYFYNTTLGIAAIETVPPLPLVISDDAWIGANAIILPGCRRIGRGAVVGAGAVVTRDVPDYAIAGGNPARVLRFRFDDDLRAAVESSRWWQLTPQALAGATGVLQTALTQENLRDFEQRMADVRDHL